MNILQTPNLIGDGYFDDTEAIQNILKMMNTQQIPTYPSISLQVTEHIKSTTIRTIYKHTFRIGDMVYWNMLSYELSPRQYNPKELSIFVSCLMENIVKYNIMIIPLPKINQIQLALKREYRNNNIGIPLLNKIIFNTSFTSFINVLLNKLHYNNKCMLFEDDINSIMMIIGVYKTIKDNHKYLKMTYLNCGVDVRYVELFKFRELEEYHPEILY